jgi:hypothetical protein
LGELPCASRASSETVYGETDKFGYHEVVNPVTPFDMKATALYLLGIDQTKLTYTVAGRNFRLTDVQGTVIKELLA